MSNYGLGSHKLVVLAVMWSQVLKSSAVLQMRLVGLRSPSWPVPRPMNKELRELILCVVIRFMISSRFAKFNHGTVCSVVIGQMRYPVQ